MKLTIDVTAEDIAKGRRSADDRCPIQRASKRAMPKAHQLRVDTNGITFNRKLIRGMDEYMLRYESDVKISLPKAAQNFILKFDEQGKEFVKPFSFKVEVPEE